MDDPLHQALAFLCLKSLLCGEKVLAKCFDAVGLAGQCQSTEG